jgi:TrmH family RNA methyltransferase
LAAARGENGEVLLVGLHLIQDAIAANVTIAAVLTDNADLPEVATLASRGTTIHTGTADVLEAASPVRSANGIVAVARWTPQPAVDLLAATDPLLVGLVGVQDPGNVGNIIRSADALGATGVLILEGTADPAAWKALRGAMGSTFRIPIGTGTLAQVIPAAIKHHVRMAATVASGGLPPEHAALAAPILVLIGSEGAGLAPDIVDAADTRVTLPMRSNVNSLNAATTAALLLWELTRSGRPSGAPHPGGPRSGAQS